jgi:hypothetical protein
MIKRQPRSRTSRRSGPCGKCGTPRESLHRDHVVPLWAGGSDDPSNYQYLCANCHQDKTLTEHRSEAFKAYARSRWTPDRIEHARQKMKDRVVSEETREKLRAANPSGVKRPDISARQKANWADPTWRARTMASIAKRVQPKRGNINAERIIQAVCDSPHPMTTKEIAETSGVKFASVNATLHFIVRDGKVRRVSRGLYAAPIK